MQKGELYSYRNQVWEIDIGIHGLNKNEIKFVPLTYYL